MDATVSLCQVQIRFLSGYAENKHLMIKYLSDFFNLVVCHMVVVLLNVMDI